jgi:hypothetical protein
MTPIDAQRKHTEERLKRVFDAIALKENSLKSGLPNNPAVADLQKIKNLTQSFSDYIAIEISNSTDFYQNLEKIVSNFCLDREEELGRI